MEKKFSINGSEVKVQEFKQSAEKVSFILDGTPYAFSLFHREGYEMTIEGLGRFKAAVSSPNKEGESMVMALNREGVIGVLDKRIKKTAAHSGSLVSPMPGKVFKILKPEGSDIKKGEPLLIMEAMKMEHSIRSDKDGKVKKIFYKVGELVQGGVILAEVE